MGCGASTAMTATTVEAESQPNLASVAPRAPSKPSGLKPQTEPELEPEQTSAPAPMEDGMLAQYGLTSADSSPRPRQLQAGGSDDDVDDFDPKEAATVRLAKGAVHRTRFRRYSSERVC
eukprot:COSAG05_NODE_9166_length_643_cov_0.626838_1_plen_119_part_00